MIQDIAPHQFKNEYRPVSPQKDSIALYYEEHTALMRRTQTGIEFPTFGGLERLNEEIMRTVFICLQLMKSSIIWLII